MDTKTCTHQRHAVSELYSCPSHGAVVFLKACLDCLNYAIGWDIAERGYCKHCTLAPLIGDALLKIMTHPLIDQDSLRPAVDKRLQALGDAAVHTQMEAMGYFVYVATRALLDVVAPPSYNTLPDRRVLREIAAR